MYTYEIVSSDQEGYRNVIRKLGEQGYRVINVSVTHVAAGGHAASREGSIYWTLERTTQTSPYR